MPSSSTQREFAVEVVRRLKAAGFQALWAGGCVRDILLGREPGDYDVATDARPDDVRQLFGRRRTLAVGASFGVIIVRGPTSADDVEVATFRTEGEYLDGRRPKQVAFCSPEEDAQRRDFTINGMFYDPVDHRVLDYVGGEDDLAECVVRAIGDPRDRMREDKLRMLRAVRFTATLEFSLDPATAEAVREMADEIRIVSAERITQEFRRMLVDKHRVRALQLTLDLRLLPIILPELVPVLEVADDVAPDQGHAAGETHESSRWHRTLRMLQHLQEPSFELAAATLLHDIPQASGGRKSPDKRRADDRGAVDMTVINPDEAAALIESICKRWRLSNKETEHITWLVVHQYDLVDAPHLPLATLKRLMAHPWIDDLLVLNRVQALAAHADLTSVVFCEEFRRNTPEDVVNPPALLGGADLIRRGMRPGPKFKRILEDVRTAQLNGEISTVPEALELAEQLYAADE
jgi:poly(A) polymerase